MTFDNSLYFALFHRIW